MGYLGNYIMALNIPGFEPLFSRDNRLSGNNETIIKTVLGNESKQTSIIVALDGSGDTDDIQEAINLIPTGVGGTIRIKEGTFEPTKPIIIIKNNVQLIGNGISTIIKATFLDNEAMIEIGNNSDTIENIKISKINLDSDRIGGFSALNSIKIQKGIGIIVSECTAENPSGNGLNINSTSSNCIVSDNYFINEQLDIEGNKNNIINNTLAAMDVDGDQNNISGNIIGATQAGFMTSSGNLNIITNNVISPDGNDAIVITNGNNNIIMNNIIENAVNDGVGLFTADNTIINSNRIINCTNGINIRNNLSDDTLIIGNNLKNNTTAINDAGTNTTAVNNKT